MCLNFSRCDADIESSGYNLEGWMSDRYTPYRESAAERNDYVPIIFRHLLSNASKNLSKLIKILFP
jgi:hypothetical protein